MVEKPKKHTTPLRRSFFSMTSAPLNFFSSPVKRNVKLGSTATTAYSRVIDFLTQDVENILPGTFRNLDSNKPTTPSTTTKKENDRNKEVRQLKRLVRRSNDILASATTVFPFDLFPDTVTVDRTKVTIVNRSFFWTEQVMSIRIEDVLNVTTSVGPFFGSLTIASRVMSSEDHFTTRFFWKQDAVHLKHIIQGYVIAQHNKIKTSHLSREELIETLGQLGHNKNT